MLPSDLNAFQMAFAFAASGTANKLIARDSRDFHSGLSARTARFSFMSTCSVGFGFLSDFLGEGVFFGLGFAFDGVLGVKGSRRD